MSGGKTVEVWSEGCKMEGQQEAGKGDPVEHWSDKNGMRPST